MKNIFKLSFYETKHHTDSITDTHFLNQEDCEWMYNTCPDWLRRLGRIHLIQVQDTCYKYKQAKYNTEHREKKMAKHNTERALEYDKVRDDIINNI
jgi:hypothetical protein